MRIKINGRDIDRGDRVTFESPEFPDAAGWVVVVIGVLAILWIASGGILP